MTAASRPDILLIICDDLAWGDLAGHGNPTARTPHLDALRAGGARLDRYLSGPLCSPARASLMTGRYHYRTRVRDTYCGRSIIDPGERTVAHVLADAGYRTGSFGKWHLGDTWPSRACDLGFQRSLMHNAGGIGQPGDLPANHAREDGCYTDPWLVEDGEIRQHRGYCTQIFADACRAFLAAEDPRPAFAYLAFNAPHTPLQIAESAVQPFRDAGLPETHARVAAMVTDIDAQVGMLVADLRRRGRLDDTLIIFTSDHGPCGGARERTLPVGRQDRWNAGLRGIKGSLHEGGVRVPCLWHWPRGLVPGRAVEASTSPIDVLPTLCAFAGAAAPSDRRIDGVDLSTALRDGREPSPRRIYLQWHRGDVPVPGRNAAVVDGNWKWYREEETRPAHLYDLARDPGETADRSAAEPTRAEALAAAYAEWFADVCSERGIGTCDSPPIGVGGPEDPVILTQNDWQVRHGEGWRRDDIRGVWKLGVIRPMLVRAVLRFRAGLPGGRALLRIGRDEFGADLAPGATALVMDGLRMAEGPADIEAWLDCVEPVPSALYRRFVPALYVELHATDHRQQA